MKRKRAKYITVMAMLITIALMLSYVETLLPVIPIPGAKLGLANIITLLALCTLSTRDAFVILIIRSIISSLLFSSLLSLAYSLTGGIISLIVMLILLKVFNDKLSLIAISIIGAIVHNLGQLLIAILIMQTVSIATLLPWLIAIAIPAGILVGLCVKFTLKHFKKIITLEGVS
jgi:heptaprenyl diphosphate synthase